MTVIPRFATIVANFPGATDVWRAFWTGFARVQLRMSSSKFCQSNSQPVHISNYVYRYYENWAKKKREQENIRTM